MRLRGKLAAALVASVIGVFGRDATAANPCVAAADAAQDLRSSGKLREARATFLVCAQKSCNSVIRAGCEKWLREVDEEMPSLVVRAVDARGRDVLGVRVTIDEAPIALDGHPAPVDPGQRVVRAKARSGDVTERKVLVALGEKARVVALRFDRALEQDGTRPADEPAPAPAPQRKTPPAEEPTATTTASEAPSNALPIALGAIGVVALGAFGYFELAGHAGYRDLEDGCFKTAAKCTSGEIDPVRQQFLAAGISLGISVVTHGAAAILYFARRPASTAATSLHGYTLRF
ncbi:MAG: hypothetical protein K0S65_2759 [Labilithrix sp.]|nr:hypothetical protein [Labilithrix sp.]